MAAIYAASDTLKGKLNACLTIDPFTGNFSNKIASGDFKIEVPTQILCSQEFSEISNIQLDYDYILDYSLKNYELDGTVA